MSDFAKIGLRESGQKLVTSGRTLDVTDTGDSISASSQIITVSSPVTLENVLPRFSIRRTYVQSSGHDNFLSWALVYGV